MVKGTSYCRYTCTHTHTEACPWRWDVCHRGVCIKQAAERALCHLAHVHFPLNVPSFLLHFTVHAPTWCWFHLDSLFLHTFEISQHHTHTEVLMLVCGLIFYDQNEPSLFWWSNHHQRRGEEEWGQMWMSKEWWEKWPGQLQAQRLLLQ